MGKTLSKLCSTRSIAASAFFALATSSWSWIRNSSRPDPSQWSSMTETSLPSDLWSMRLTPDDFEFPMADSLRYMKLFTGPSLHSAEPCPVQIGFPEQTLVDLHEGHPKAWRLFLAIINAENEIDQTHPFSD
jgi:hypothetical protein